MSDLKGQDDNLTVSRVYDTLKSPRFLKSLYWDILSGIKKKSTYKLMRGITEGLITQNMKGIEGLGDSEADTLRRRAIVAEISVMSFTIDTIFSKILYMKLEKACKAQIIEIIHELRQEGKIPENVWSTINLSTETSGSQTSAENTAVKSNPVQIKKEAQKVPTRVGKRRRIDTSKIQDKKRADANKGILDDLAKVNNFKPTDKDVSTINEADRKSPKKKTEEIVKQECSKKNIPGRIPEPLTKANVSKLPSSVDNKKSEDFFDINDQDNSDALSDISIGVVSNVSSVHTSDLSSFDDEITLSSDDEYGQKKKVPLKEVQKKYSKSNVSGSSANEKNGVKSLKSSESKVKPSEKITDNKTITKKVSMNITAKSTKKVISPEPSNENGLSKRARKPNSRYSSDNMLCPTVKVKERKKQIKTYSKLSNDELSPPSKKAKVDDIYGDVVTITKSRNNEKTIINVKSPEKPSEILSLKSFQSHSANRSLTSRRSAPLTLFST